MNKTPLSINYKHQILLDDYLKTVDKAIKDCVGNNISKLNDFTDITNIIVQHHNEYRPGTDIGSLYDFLSIIPTNLSVAVQGFLAGIENRRNVITVRAYRYMLNNAAYKLIDDLEDIELDND